MLRGFIELPVFPGFFLLLASTGAVTSALYDQWTEVASVLFSSVVQSQTAGCVAGDWGAR